MSVPLENSDIKIRANDCFNGALDDLDRYGSIQNFCLKKRCPSLGFAMAVFDEIAVLLAKAYESGSLDFEMADWVANEVQSEMLELMLQLQPKSGVLELPVRWMEVYDAFDAGEHDHFGRHPDPVAEVTDPAIKEFLTNLREVKPHRG